MGCLGGSHSQRRWSIGMGSDGKTPGSGSKGCVGPHWAVEFWGPSIIRPLGRSLDSMSSSSYVCLLLSCLVLSDSLQPMAAHQASLSFSISQSLLKFMSTELVMPSSHLILCHPLLLLPSIFPSIRVFWVSSSHHVAKVLSFSFSISPSNEYSGLISFKIDFKILISNPEIRFYLIQFRC